MGIKMIKFSVITVCLNPGESLKSTLASIEKQTYTNYEVIIKDGGSTDGSMEFIPTDERFRLVDEPDTGIYDAMNIAIKYATGDVLIFMNCGDDFHSETVLSETVEKIEKWLREKNTESLEGIKAIFYGDAFNDLSETVAKAPSVITEKVCYNGIPCHQAIFYSKEIFKEKIYDCKYKIRGDYDHFLYFFFKGNADFIYLDLVVCDYEGGGFSESKKNRKRNSDEHKEICAKYISVSHRALYRGRLIVTLQPLRAAIARSKRFGGLYEKIRRKLS